MFPIFYALHSDAQLDFAKGSLPEVKCEITTDPDGFYNPYTTPYLEADDEVCFSED
ncbi:MAG: hypothetical protein J6Q69_02415 [Clostridia bacterium]|nr:hypothetical protein [Clostridia bacterium]